MRQLIVLLLFFGTSLVLYQCSGNQSSDKSSDEKQEAKKPSNPETDLKADIKDQGANIVKGSRKALKSKLQSAIAEGGISHAIEFCSHEAMPLTDSLSEDYDAQISRVSHKNRNPQNEANEKEAELINQYQVQLAKEQKLEPTLVEKESTYHYYSPITIQSSLCLSCHGKVGEDILEEDYIVLQNLYPNDQATGFGMDDIRGLWKIAFEKEAS